MRSFIPYPADSPFPIQNLPYAIFSPTAGSPRRVGVAIGDYVLDLAVLEEHSFFNDVAGFTQPGRPIFAQTTLNPFMALGRPTWHAIRTILVNLLHEDSPALRDDDALRHRAFHPMTAVTLHLPADIGDYTDFYSSREHASNVGTMFRGPENALTPNWLYLPIAYHGRASSIILSGTGVRRPPGQTRPEGTAAPPFGPTRQLDFELEMGFFIGPGNELGRPIPVQQAADHIFGLVLVNDWSARDIQAWEYQPLGPFLAKNFATSISPWVVTLDALEPFRCPSPPQDPTPLPYLQSQGDWAYDIRLEVHLQSQAMTAPMVISRSNFRHLYWNMLQQLAHHTITGCNLRPGDLLASGTISGPTPDAYGSLLELTWRGTRPITLPSGEERKFLLDGDRLTLTGYCQGEGYRVGFGEVTGLILPAHQLS